MPNGNAASAGTSWRRAAIAAGVIALAIVGALLWSRKTPPLALLRITAGEPGTSRDGFAHALAGRASRAGVRAEVLPAEGDELALVQERGVELALVSSVRDAHGYPDVREVAPLHVEALHVLVKRELAGDLGTMLAGLRGRRVDIGPRDSEDAALARAVLAFTGLAEGDPQSGGIAVEQIEVPELERRATAGDREALPDAIFHLGTVPSRLALLLVQHAGYELVPVPFANAFRLRTEIEQDDGDASTASLVLADVGETEIPAFVYRTDPPVPAAPLPTLGATLLLVAHRDVPEASVVQVLDLLYSSAFSHVAHPPLDRGALAARPALRRHAGTEAFLSRDAPLLDANDVDELNNTLGIVGALLGGSLFVWQGLRQARQARRDRLFADHMLRIAAIEERLVTLELDADPDLEQLAQLERELLEMKRAALGQFSRGELDSYRELLELLGPVDTTREHVRDVLLHARDRAEDEAASAT